MTGDEDEVLDQELFAAFAATNPVDPADVPGPDSPQARALFQEITMTTITSRWSRPAALTAVAAAAAAATVGIVLFVGNDSAPNIGPIADPPTNNDVPPIAGMCAEAYSIEGLPNREFAFDGTLASIDGDNFTFEVTEVFRGDIGSEVTLGGATLITDGSFVGTEGAGLAVGDRALVSGDGGFAWGCGFTMPWDEATAADWRTTLG